MTFNYSTEPKETVGACNLCGWGDQFLPYASRDRYGLAVTSVKCPFCGLVFLNPRMTAAAYAEFYRSGVYRELLSEFYGRPITAESIETEQQAYAERLIRVLEPIIAVRSVYHLLDIGGSTGVVAKALAKHFELDATVIEPSEAEAKRAEARGLTVFRGALEEYQPDGKRFELVTLCQTVDHLLDITGALLKVRGLLRDGGLFFLDIVDYHVPEARGREAAIKVDHPFYLEAKTLNAYLYTVGLNPLVTTPSSDGLHVDFICEAA